MDFIEFIKKLWDIREVLITIAIIVFLIMALAKFVASLQQIKDFFGGKKQ